MRRARTDLNAKSLEANDEHVGGGDLEHVGMIEDIQLPAVEALVDVGCWTLDRAGLLHLHLAWVKK